MLLHAQSAEQAIGLTGRTQGAALEFAMYEPGMRTAVMSWIDGITMMEASKKKWWISKNEWWINENSSYACLLGASSDAVSNEPKDGNRNSVDSDMTDNGLSYHHSYKSHK